MKVDLLKAKHYSEHSAWLVIAILTSKSDNRLKCSSWLFINRFLTMLHTRLLHHRPCLDVEEFRSKSFEPYAYKWDRIHTANQLQEMYKHLGNGEELNRENDQVSVSGRIVARRAIGRLVFLTLRDDSWTIQFG